MPNAAFKTALGNSFNNTSGTTLAITTTAAIAIGDLVAVRWASDNLSATTPTATCADGGNTYTVQRQAAVNATAAAGVAGGILTTKATVARPSGSTITLTFSGAIVGKAAYAESFTGVENTTRVGAAGGTSSGGTTATAGPLSAGVVAGDLIMGFSAVQSRTAATGDADTTNGTWSTKVGVNGGATTAQDTGSVQINGQYKIITAAGAQTYDNTITNTYWVSGLIALQATPDPAITQASYRFYAEGTETGSTALGTQDTAYAASLGSGDLNLQLRTRLQSTNATALPATDDWQLDYELNGNGTWLRVGPSLLDSYDETNSDGVTAFIAPTVGIGQSFTGSGGKLTRAGFWMQRVGTVSGTLNFQLFNNTPPVGGVLATSASIDASSLSTTLSWVELDFDGTFTLNQFQNYTIAAMVSVGGSAGNCLAVGYDSSSPTHSGSGSLLQASWSSSASDRCFRVYHALGVVAYNSPSLTDGAATTNRLGAGTGSFAAGEISETGVITDLGWSGNNYTELLYSLTLKASLLPTGTTIRFRTLRNGFTAWTTYTAVPTVTTSSAPFPSTGLVGWWDADDAATITAGTGIRVATWADKSISGYNVSQGTDAQRPDRVLGGIRAGRYSLRYNTSTLLEGAGNSGVNQKPLTILAIIKHDGTAADRAVISTTQTNGFYLELNPAHQMVVNQQYVVGIATSTTPVRANVPALLEFSYTATGDWKFYLNGVLDGSGTNDVPFNSGTPVQAFFDGIGQPFTGGDIGEVVKFNYVLSDTDRQAVEQYLINKWQVIPQANLQLWLDANDASVITYGSGNTVSQWRDKSGAGRTFTGGNAQRNSATVPTPVTVSGPAGAMTGPLVTSALDNWAMFVVCRRTGGVANSVPFFNGTGSSNGYGPAVRAGSTNYGFLLGGIVWHQSNTVDDGARHIHTLSRAAGVYGHYVDGVATSNSGQTLQTPAVPTVGSYIPAIVSGHDFAGDVCEVITYDRVLTTTERQQIESYLTSKWLLKVGSASTIYTEAPVAVGKRVAKGTAAVTSWTSDCLAVGKKTPKSAPVINNTFNPVAAGKKTPKGTAATGNWTAAVAAVGAQPVSARTGTGTTTWTMSTAGGAPTTGTYVGYRTFDGSTSRVQLAIAESSAQTLDSYSQFALVRAGASGGGASHSWFSVTRAASLACYWYLNWTGYQETDAQSGYTSGGPTTAVSVAEGWCIVGVTKASGANPIYHKCVMSTGVWAHEAGGSLPSVTPIGAGGSWWLGWDGVGGGEQFQGDIAVESFHNRPLTTLEVEALKNGLSKWATGAVHVWPTDRAAVNDIVGTANQIAVVNAPIASGYSPLVNDLSSGPVVYSDAFNRADGALATPWVNYEGTHSIVSNKVTVGPLSPNISYYSQTFAADQWAEADLASLIVSGSTIVPCTRITAGGDFYYLWFNGSNVAIFKRVGGTYSQVGSNGPAVGTALKGRLEAQGTTIRAYVDGVLAITATDTSIATGRPGILSANGAGAVLDNWRGGDLPYSAPIYTDDFNRANGDLGSGPDWDTMNFSINITSNHLDINSSGCSCAYMGADFPATSHWAEGVMTIQDGQEGSLGPSVRQGGSENSYYSWLRGPNNPPTFEIWRQWFGYSNIGGYAIPVPAAKTGPVTVAVEVDGTTIRGYVNGVKLIDWVETDPGNAPNGSRPGINGGMFGATNGLVQADDFRCGPGRYPGLATTGGSGGGGGGGAVGSMTPKGVATTQWTAACAAVGKKTPKATANTANYVEACAAVGKKTPKATANTANYTEAVTSVGKRTPKATANVGNFTEACAAVGKRIPKSSVTTTWLSSVTAVTIFTDTFSGAAAPLNTANWGVLPGYGPSLTTDGAGNIDNASYGGNTLKTPLGPDHFAELEFICGSGVTLGIIVRADASGKPSYEAGIYGTSGTNLYVYRNYQDFGSVAVPLTTGNTYVFRVVALGSTVSVLINGTTVYSRTDAAPLAGGYAAIDKDTDGGAPCLITDFRAGSAAGAVGYRVPKGAAPSGNFLEALAVTSSRTPKGTITVSDTWVPAAVGAMPVVGQKQGAGTVNNTFNPVAAGKRTPKGAASTGNYTEAVTAAGQKIQKGTATNLAWVEAPTVAGKRTPKATATTTYLDVVAATGKKSPKGASTTTWTYVQFAQGVAPIVGVKQGSGIVYASFVTAAVGYRSPKGGNTTTWLNTPAAVGKKTPKGAATTTTSDVVASVGKRAPKSTLSTTYTEATAAAGKKAPKGTSNVGNHSWTLTCQGSMPLVGYNKGSAIAFNSFDPAAVGKRTPKGSNTAAVTFAVAAAGKKLQKATATTTFLWQADSTGKKYSRGTAVITHAWVGSASGYEVPEGRGDSDYWFSQVALGLSGIAGAIEGLWNGEEVVAMQYGDKAVIEWLMVPS